MKHVTKADYMAAKMEIIGGVGFKKESALDDGKIKNTYSTEENGNFYEILLEGTGCFVFWSDKNPIKQSCDLPTLVEKDAWPAYGDLLADSIRANTQDFSKISDYEKFVLNRGHLYRTEEELKAGYNRAWESQHEILITEFEFMQEAGPRYDGELLKSVYGVLIELVKQKKIKPSEVYHYARNKWCLHNPEAIIAYESFQRGRDEWLVNNCDTEIAGAEAVLKVNREWGFEASRIDIVGVPYYDATDCQFIRFNCVGVAWLWKNGELYGVYAD